MIRYQKIHQNSKRVIEVYWKVFCVRTRHARNCSADHRGNLILKRRNNSRYLVRIEFCCNLFRSESIFFSILFVLHPNSVRCEITSWQFSVPLDLNNSPRSFVIYLWLLFLFFFSWARSIIIQITKLLRLKVFWYARAQITIRKEWLNNKVERLKSSLMTVEQQLLLNYFCCPSFDCCDVSRSGGRRIFAIKAESANKNKHICGFVSIRTLNV